MARNRIITVTFLALLGAALWLCGALADVAAMYAAVFLLAVAVGAAIAVFRTLCILVHELGHALAALALGFRVRRVVIGVGPLVRRLNLAGARVEIRAAPFGGLMCPGPAEGRLVRLRFALVCLSGPVAELAFLWWLLHGADRLQSSVGHSIPVHLAVTVIVILAIPDILSSAIPWRWRTPEGELDSDALLILRTLFSRRRVGVLEQSISQVAEGAKYPRDAFAFVLESVYSYGGEHVDGRTLCWTLRDRAIWCFGSRARETLGSWNVESCEDFGRIVYAMVEAGLIGRSEEDSIDDFRNVYCFDEEFIEAGESGADPPEEKNPSMVPQTFSPGQRPQSPPPSPPK